MIQEWVERELMPKYGVAWWKCNEPSGNLIDSKGSNTGTVTGVARVDDGNGGYALDFNGTSSYVSFTGKIVPVGAKSIYFRFKRDGIPNGQYGERLITNVKNGGSNYGITISVNVGNGAISVNISKADPNNVIFSIDSIIDVCDGQWHDVLFTWDGTTNENGVKLYIDDIINPVNTTIANSTETNQPTYNLTLGKLADSNANYFKGQLDNIQIYNKAIDPVAKFSLIKSDNKIYTLVNNTWTEITEGISEQVFIKQGITNLIDIKEEQWSELKSPIELLTWCDSDISGVSIEYDYNELILPTATITVPPYTLLDTLENPKLLIYSEAPDPTVNIKAIPEAQLVKPSDDIKLKMLEKINSITLTSNKLGAGDIRIIFSVDGGATWKTYNSLTLEFEDIDISNLGNIKSNGINADTFNTIGAKWNEVITESKIRFAYYLEIDSLEDIAEVDKLNLNMDIQGRLKKAKHGVDYDYEYDNEHIYVTFLTDGSYKVNYTM